MSRFRSLWAFAALVSILVGCGQTGLPGSGKPPAPTNVRVVPGNASNTISWDALDTTLTVTYNIYYSNTNSTPSPEDNDLAIPTVTSPYIHAGLTNGQRYYYTVTAVVNGKESLPSEVREGIPSASINNLLPPANINAQSGNNQIVISWQPPNNTAGYTYNLYWSYNANLTVATATKVENVRSPHTLTGLTNDVPVYFALTTVSAGLESQLSAIQTLTPATIAPPTNVQNQPGNTTVDVSWTAAIGAVDYLVEWSTDPTVPAATSAKQSTQGSTSYTITGLTNEVPVYFRISSKTATETSQPTEIFSATPSTRVPPTNIQLTAGNGYLEVSWQTNFNGETYNLYWSTDSNITTTSGTKVTNVTSPYRLKNLTNNTRVYIILTTVQNGIESAPSSVRNAMPIGSTQVPGVPTNVSATPNRISNTLVWSPSDGATKYRVYWSPNSAFTTQSAEGFADTQNNFYTHNGITTVRYYFVTALNEIGESSASTIVSSTPFYDPVGEADFVNASVTRGAHLYYKWFDNSTAPQGDHPLWMTRAQVSDGNFYNKRQGGDSWRCIECHGSDYKGANGFYGASSDHYTGFTGVAQAAQTRSYLEIFMFIKTGYISNDFNKPAHALWNYMQDQDYYDLVKFIKEGLVDPELMTDGDALAGETFLNAGDSTPLSCSGSACHASPEQRTLITNLADTDYPALLHQIRYGKAGIGTMPGNPNAKQVRDAFTYIINTMVSSFDSNRFENGSSQHTDFNRGKSLYENWAEFTQQTPPTSTHTLWPQGNTNISGAETWSCQTCHGPDYLGRSGTYGQGEYNSGIAGIVRLSVDQPYQRSAPKAVFDFLRSDATHSFSAYLDDDDLYALTRFVMSQRSTFNNSAKRGGLLYDNWWIAKNVAPPATKHPLWAGAVPTTNADTWRCKSCHGWDYGNLKPGLRTVIDAASVRSFIATGVASQYNKINLSHVFSPQLSETDIEHLAQFIAGGTSDSILSQSDMDAVLASPVLERGSINYNINVSPANCVACHGENGKALPVDIVNMALTDREEFLHKVRYGHPGSSMIPTDKGFIGLSPAEAADMWLYVQSITDTPGGGDQGAGPYANAKLARGGRLFDNWLVEMGTSVPGFLPPAGSNPLWNYRNVTIPDLPPTTKVLDSWRCKSCHDWTYQGVGYYGTSNGRDNLFLRLYELKNDPNKTEQEQRQEIFNWIKNGISDLHNYGVPQTNLPTGLRDAEIWDLTKFMFEGLIDVDAHIVNQQPVGADVANGEAYYLGNVDPGVNCSSCHGLDGLGIIGIGTEQADIFDVAKNEPAEFIHKVRFGQPGRSMPSLIDTESADPVQHAKDILGYGQQQFDARTP